MAADSITAGLARLHNLSRPARGGYDEDIGEEIDDSTVAGGGHGSRRTEITSHRLRISHALKSFLAHNNVVSTRDAALESEGLSPALEALLDKPHIQVPAELIDRSHPLSEYFISSSHNTYLLGHQLQGQSSASAYESTLSTGARCVEIDAWDNSEDKDEPKVTHGYTLVSNIPFRAVCEAIRDVIDREAAMSVDKQGYRAAPIILSLENHCGAYGQMRLVEIMKEVWGDRLLSKAIREKGQREQDSPDDDDERVCLDELGSKIVLIVEYFFPTEGEDSNDDDSSSSSSSSEDEDEDEDERRDHLAYKARKKEAKRGGIIAELAALGVYAQSVKPRDSSWYESTTLHEGPPHHLINVSETGLQSLMPANNAKIARHNARHLMRVFPKGTRISSKNLKQVPFWGVGAQICAMNWQTFGDSMQLNEAMFSGTEGYVLKPAALRAGGDGRLNTGRRTRLRLHVAGATDVPVPPDRSPEEVRPYVTCSLVHPDDVDGRHQKRKTHHYRQHKLGLLHRGENPPPTDPLWDHVLEWEYDDNELVFLRIFVKDDVSFAENPIYAVAAVRLLYVVPGWSFIRLLDLGGHETTCSLLVKFDFEDASILKLPRGSRPRIIIE